MNVLRRVLLAVLALASTAQVALAQSAAQLKPAVREFVSVDDVSVALTHARVIDGTGGAILQDATVLLKDGKITAVGPSARTRAPAGAKVIDLTGYTVIPGIVRMH